MPIPETPLIRSKQELRAAAAALERMREGIQYEQFAAEWQTLVDRLEKVWVKAERECQQFENKFRPWQGAFQAVRKSDPLLRYLYQSRHADQHSVQVLTGFEMWRLLLKLPPKGSAGIQIDEEKGTMTVSAGDQGIQFGMLPPRQRYCLFPITNQGVEYQTPTEHLGIQLDGTDPLLVAEKGLAFYQDFLRQAEEKFFTPAS
jgi:hypothetical protein